MPANVDIREGVAEAFNVLSEEFLNGVTITLLKAAENYDEFDEILIIDSNRFFEYSNYRKNFLLEIANDSDELTEALGIATHVQVNDDIYVITDDDPTSPLSTDVTWKIYCDLFERKGKYSGLDI